MTFLRSVDDFRPRLAAFYACLFVILGIQMPFFPLWLEARGLDPGQIGVVLALPIAMRIVAVPFVNRAVDRSGNLRAGLIAAAFAGTVGFVVVAFCHGFIAILVAAAFASLVSSPLMSLADAYALKGLAARQHAYGPVRLWGSAAFIATNIGAGFLLTIVARQDLIWLIAAAFMMLSAASLLLYPLPSAPLAASAPQAAGGHRWLSLNFLAVAAAASLIQASHALYYGFSTVDWTAKGIPSTTIGLLWALGVLAEIVLFALSGRLTLGPVPLIAIGAAGAVIRWTVMAFDPPMTLLPFVQALHALSFGATHLGSIQFIARSAGDRHAAAQGDFATVLAVGSAAATGVSGLLYGSFGDFGYTAMAVLAALGGACLVLNRLSRS